MDAVRDDTRFDCALTLPAGEHVVPIVLMDVAGNRASADVLALIDQSARVVTIVQPAGPIVTNEPTIELFGSVADDHFVDRVTVNGVLAEDNAEFSHVVLLDHGVNAIEVRATDRAGNVGTAMMEVRRYERSLIDITSPADFEVLDGSTVTVTGTMSGPVASIEVNGIAAVISGAAFTAVGVPLAQGRTIVSASARTLGGQIVVDHINVYRDAIPPRVKVYAPEAGAMVTASPVTSPGRGGQCDR